MSHVEPIIMSQITSATYASCPTVTNVCQNRFAANVRKEHC